MRRPISLKSNTYTESMDVDATGISEKETWITRGGLAICRKAMAVARRQDE